MAKKTKATAPREPGEFIHIKRLNEAQCKMTAVRINGERRTYQAALEQYSLCNKRDGYPGSFVPIWPADFDTCVAKINHLFHPEEAATIIENLTA